MLTDILLIVLTVAVVAAVRQWCFEPVRVKGASMRSTLSDGEVLLVTKGDYLFSAPQRGEVVICHYPGRYIDKWKLFPQYFVKRIAAIPGDTVEFRDGILFVNGEAVNESYVDPEHNRRSITTEPHLLGEDEYYVLGDNRDNSNDSRRIGPITRRMIVGRVRQVIYPFSHIRDVS